MPTHIQLNIPTPCHERWEDMDAVERGRFCQQCQKTVFDLSQKSDAELIRFLADHKNSACGRFLPHQLNRALVDRSNLGFNWRTIPLAVGTFLGITAVSNVAAQTQPSENGVSTQQVETTNISVIENTETTTSVDSAYKIKGRIIDSLGHLPVPYAIVSFVGTPRAVITDFDGYFEMIVPDYLDTNALELEVSCVGFEDLQVPIDSNKVRDDANDIGEVKLNNAETYVLGISIVEHPRKHKVKRFFRRIFRR